MYGGIIMRNIVDIYEGIMQDIDDVLNNSDHDMILYILLNGTNHQRKEVRNPMYIDISGRAKRMRRKNTFKANKVYIQFMNYNSRTPFWGYRLGTCTPHGEDILLTQPSLSFDVVSMKLTPDDSSYENLKLNSNLKFETYELPEDWIWLFEELYKKARVWERNPGKIEL